MRKYPFQRALAPLLTSLLLFGPAACSPPAAQSSPAPGAASPPPRRWSPPSRTGSRRSLSPTF